MSTGRVGLVEKDMDSNWYLKKIPKVAHFYWGNNTISFLRYLTVFLFNKFNRGWKMKLYYPKTKYQGEKTWDTWERYGKFKGENYIEKLFDMNIEKVEVDFDELGFNHNVPENYKADFLRWKILSTEGGLWSDFDIIYFRPMESLYFNNKANEDIDTIVCINEHQNHSVGFLLSSPGNEFYKFIHEESYSKLDTTQYQSMGPIILNSYFPTPSRIAERFDRLNLYNMKMNVVYPVHDNPTHGKWAASIYHSADLSQITADTIGLHWYAGHPEADEWENKLTENNFQEFDNVLAKVISLAFTEQYREGVFPLKVSIICLIYKNVEWLKFVYEQVLKYTDMTDKEFFFVANDANDVVLTYLRDSNIPHYVLENTPEHKAEWYINNVYRAYNFGAGKARGDFLVFIHSDMAFSPGWVDNLIKIYNGSNCISSRLVESGKYSSGQYGVGNDFGRISQLYNEPAFQQYASGIASSNVEDGGLYIPLFIHKQHFDMVGGYSEGNITVDSDPWQPVIASRGEPCIIGYEVLRRKLAAKGIVHQTAFNSIIYHFQSGESDAPETLRNKPVQTIRAKASLHSTPRSKGEIPMISVMMPVYNAEKFLHAAIESVLNQTEENFEFIIVNDGSTDKSEDIILSFSDPRIRYFKQDNGGEAAARNTVLEHAKGDFIVFQDADDISLPMRFEILKRHFIDQSIGIVHSDMIFINENDHPIHYLASCNMERNRMLRFFLKAGTPFNNPSMMVRREALKEFRYDTSLRIGTDTDMVFQIARSWVTAHVPQPLLLYRRHSNNLTNPGNLALNALHIRKFLERHSLMELFPELDWENDSITNNQARACALVSLFLFRRNMFQDAVEWSEKAAEFTVDPDAEYFLRAINSLKEENCANAINLLYSCSVCDHVIENYLGEATGLMGRRIEAYQHFRNSLELNPYYIEPLENLRLLGKIQGLSTVELPVHVR